MRPLVPSTQTSASASSLWLLSDKGRSRSSLSTSSSRVGGLATVMSCLKGGRNKTGAGNGVEFTCVRYEGFQQGNNVDRTRRLQHRRHGLLRCRIRRASELRCKELHDVRDTRASACSSRKDRKTAPFLVVAVFREGSQDRSFRCCGSFSGRITRPLLSLLWHFFRKDHKTAPFVVVAAFHWPQSGYL